jgi:hypothetical protein
MKKFKIIRARMNGGKTTTAGLVFNQLKDQADFAKVYNYNFEELQELQYSDSGSLSDFIGVVILNGKVIIIISRGDVASELEELLDALMEENLVSELTTGLSKHIDIVVCCARSQNRRNSTIEMLRNRIPEENRETFWTEKSEKFEDRFEVKEKVVSEILSGIQS